LPKFAPAAPESVPGAGPNHGNRAPGNLRRRETAFSIALVAPALIIIAGIFLYPALFTLILSFAEFDMAALEIGRWVGLKNYEALLANAGFADAIWRTIYFGLLIAFPATVTGFLIALLLNEEFYGRNLLRVVVVLPWAVPPVVAGVLWGQMFHADVGFVNALLYRTGLIDSYRIWFGDGSAALHIIALAEGWKAIPFMVLFILAGLQSLPSQLHEAAAVDGGTSWQRFRYIVFPLMLPIIIPLMLIQFVWAMKAFDTIFVLTRGGPAGQTTTLNYFVYIEAFQSFDLGRASAAAYSLLVVTLMVVLLVTIIQRYAAARRAQA